MYVQDAAVPHLWNSIQLLPLSYHNPIPILNNRFKTFQ